MKNIGAKHVFFFVTFCQADMRPKPHTLFQRFQTAIQPMTRRYQFEPGWTESLFHFA